MGAKLLIFVKIYNKNHIFLVLCVNKLAICNKTKHKLTIH